MRRLLVNVHWIETELLDSRLRHSASFCGSDNIACNSSSRILAAEPSNSRRHGNNRHHRDATSSSGHSRTTSGRVRKIACQ